jgi:hypothetical protein
LVNDLEQNPPAPKGGKKGWGGWATSQKIKLNGFTFSVSFCHICNLTVMSNAQLATGITTKNATTTPQDHKNYKRGFKAKLQ